ncbi:MAG: hypothetical protein J5506_05040, partial [Prevotella sp.]|nr:hypothetical protein [Prevotella sp.]
MEKTQHNHSNLQASDLFARVEELTSTIASTSAEDVLANAYRQLHETLVLTCAAGVSNTGQAFGNLFSQVDFLCKQHGIGVADKIAIQTMRRHSNHPEGLTTTELLHDARALSLFIAAVCNTRVPDGERREER